MSTGGPISVGSSIVASPMSHVRPLKTATLAPKASITAMNSEPRLHQTSSTAPPTLPEFSTASKRHMGEPPVNPDETSRLGKSLTSGVHTKGTDHSAIKKPEELEQTGSDPQVLAVQPSNKILELRAQVEESRRRARIAHERPPNAAKEVSDRIMNNDSPMPTQDNHEALSSPESNEHSDAISSPEMVQETQTSKNGGRNVTPVAEESSEEGELSEDEEVDNSDARNFEMEGRHQFSSTKGNHRAHPYSSRGRPSGQGPSRPKQSHRTTSQYRPANQVGFPVVKDSCRAYSVYSAPQPYLGRMSINSQPSSGYPPSQGYHHPSPQPMMNVDPSVIAKAQMLASLAQQPQSRPSSGFQSTPQRPTYQPPPLFQSSYAAGYHSQAFSRMQQQSASHQHGMQINDTRYPTQPSMYYMPPIGMMAPQTYVQQQQPTYAQQQQPPYPGVQNGAPSASYPTYPRRSDRR